jgi:hypothetical protein
VPPLVDLGEELCELDLGERIRLSRLAQVALLASQRVDARVHDGAEGAVGPRLYVPTGTTLATCHQAILAR